MTKKSPPIKRRDFLSKSAAATGYLLASNAFSQVRPCPPVMQGSDVGANGGCAVDAEQDWLTRISGSGVVWYHDFRSAAEVDAFRWTNGYRSGNDPLARGNGASNVSRNTGDGITGGGCLEIFHPSGGTDGMHWWRPFSPMTSPGNGRATDDPAANGTLAVQTWNATDGGNQTQFWDYGHYSHTSNHVPGRHDGDEFYLQMRVKRDARRIQGSNDSNSVGKFSYLTVCNLSLSDQEIVTYSNGGGSGNNFRMYGGWQIFSALDQAPGGDGSIQPGGNSETWSFALDGTWDTIMYHLVVGRENVNETILEVYGAHEGETEFTKFWEQTFAVWKFDPGRDGYQALICTTYNNGADFNPGFFERWDQIIFSKEFIPCPTV